MEEGQGQCGTSGGSERQQGEMEPERHEVEGRGLRPRAAGFSVELWPIRALFQKGRSSDGQKDELETGKCDMLHES